MAYVIDTAGDDNNLAVGDTPLVEEQNSVNQLNASSIVKQIIAEYKKSAVDNTSTCVKKKKSSLYEPAITGKRNYRKRKDEDPFDNATLKSNKKELEALLQKSVLTPEFHQSQCVPPYEISKRKLKLQRQKEAEKTKGKNWFNLPATEMTDEIKHDLEVLQMRSVLDPKHFYKKNDLKVLPKYFQVGKVVDSPLDYYNNRVTRKERKKTLVDELLADAQFNKYNKRKYKEIIEERQKTHYKAWKQAKKLKRKNK